MRKMCQSEIFQLIAAIVDIPFTMKTAPIMIIVAAIQKISPLPSVTLLMDTTFSIRQNILYFFTCDN